MKITKYVLVSQGIQIWETLDKEAAEKYKDAENEDWLEYCQDCYDNYERPADNEIFLYGGLVTPSAGAYPVERSYRIKNERHKILLKQYL